MSLSVREQGPVIAPTIVFVRGGGGSGWLWQPQLDLTNFHVLVTDQALPNELQPIDGSPS